jgi:hypothetical protein
VPSTKFAGTAASKKEYVVLIYFPDAILPSYQQRGLDFTTAIIMGPLTNQMRLI